jgi:trk system potassium uptake protein TrkH
MTTAAPAGPWHERAFFGMFHAVSAYCNAGFSTLPANLEGLGGKWQIWGVMAGLIVIGGLGFETLRSVFAVLTWPLARRWPWRNPNRQLHAPRLTATARLSAITTFVLLLVGTVAFFVLEADGVLEGRPPGERLANAWFQSVTFRTAGFNTVSFADLYPSTRLIGIVLMFIGGSPGSTAGGIKTVVFALMILATAGTIRGRERIEIAGRSIPDGFIRRGAAVMTLATGALFTATLLITIFEQRPELFLHHLFETASALGTVGLSTLGTANLRAPSQVVLIATMFIGRVGPLTLLVALARRARETKYEYPTERVALG